MSAYEQFPFTASDEQDQQSLVEYDSPEHVAYALSNMSDMERRQAEQELFASRLDQPLSSDETGELLEVIKDQLSAQQMEDDDVNMQAVGYIQTQLYQGKDFETIRLEVDESLTANTEAAGQEVGIAALALMDMIEQHPDEAREVLGRQDIGSVEQEPDAA